MNREPKRSVTVEDLLQLKRAERPSAEFWTSFERDLRAKQLAALVEKRPWWRTMPQVFAGFSRYHLPIGATAILALTFVSIREYQVVPSVGSGDAVKTMPTAPVAQVTAPVAYSGKAEPLFAPSSAPVTTPDRTPQPSRVEAAAGIGLERVVPVVAMLGENPAERVTPSARTIALNRAAVQTFDPVLANRFLASAHGFEARALPARQPAVEPLAQVSVSEARRSRQLAAAMPAAFDSYSGSSEKIARKISDERLYDSVSRFGARGNSLNVKF